MKMLLDEICLKETIAELCKGKSLSAQVLSRILGKHFSSIQIKECLLELLKNDCVSCVNNRWQVKELTPVEALMEKLATNVSVGNQLQKSESCSPESNSVSPKADELPVEQTIKSNKSKKKRAAKSTVTTDVKKTLPQKEKTDVYPEKIIPTVKNKKMSVQCPQCNTSFPIIPEYMGMKVECDYCSLKFYIASKLPLKIQK